MNHLFDYIAMADCVHSKQSIITVVEVDGTDLSEKRKTVLVIKKKPTVKEENH